MLTDQEIQFYRELYKLMSDPTIRALIENYAQMNYNKAVKKLRTKLDIYDQGCANGNADAWHELLNLKKSLTEIMKNVG